jgi:hypothetical protein
MLSILTRGVEKDATRDVFVRVSSSKISPGRSFIHAGVLQPAKSWPDLCTKCLKARKREGAQLTSLLILEPATVHQNEAASAVHRHVFAVCRCLWIHQPPQPAHVLEGPSPDREAVDLARHEHRGPAGRSGESGKEIKWGGESHAGGNSFFRQ